MKNEINSTDMPVSESFTSENLRLCSYISAYILFQSNSSSVINFHCTFKHFNTHNFMASSLKECHNIIHEFCE